MTEELAFTPPTDRLGAERLTAFLIEVSNVIAAVISFVSPERTVAVKVFVSEVPGETVPKSQVAGATSIFGAGGAERTV